MGAPKPSIRKWHTTRAIESTAALEDVIGDLTEAEVLHVLELESQTQRRKTHLDMLIRRAGKLYKQRLKELYHVHEKSQR